MRLEELTGIKTAVAHYGTVEHFQQISEFLAKYGFKKLGGGSFVNVYTHPNMDYVLKVFHKLDYGYLAFLRYVLANQGNPTLPRIIGIPKKLNTNRGPGTTSHSIGEWYFVRMEKLEPLDISIASDFFGGMVQFASRMAMNRVRTDDPNPKLAPGTLKRIRAWEAQHPDLAETIRGIRELIPDSDKFGFDLHDENLMRRGDQIVITDPLS